MADKENTSTDIFTNPQRFEEQCFFMDNLDFFVKDLSTQGYLNFVKMQMSPKQDTSAFFNKLTVPKGLDKFLNITPAQAATLVPYIRLYKVFYPSPLSEGTDYEIIFENYIAGDALKKITSSRTGRGAGAGIKSFSWENKGETQATANRIFESKLELYFQDFDALNMEQTAVSPDGKSSRKISFLDLIVPKGRSNPNEWDKDYFRIKVALGWSVPNQKLSNSGVSFSQDEIGAIERAGKVFFLNLQSHELSFNPDGQINLSITYVGGTESVIGSPDADVLALDVNSPEIKKVEAANKKLEKTRKIKKLNSDQKCGTKEERESRTEGIEDAEKEDVEKLKEAKKEANLQRYLNFTNYLYARTGAMRYIDIPTEKLKVYIESKGKNPSDVGARSLPADFLNNKAKKGTIDLLAGADAIQRAAVAHAEGDAAGATDNATSTGGERDDAQRMIYTSFGNVLEAALYAINKDSNRKEIRTIVGMISVPDPLTGRNKVVNVADLPVSYKLFSTWFYNVCISKNLKQWRFKKFLHQASQNLFRSIIKAKCFDDDQISGLGDLDLKIETLELPQRTNGGDAIFPELIGPSVELWNSYDTTRNSAPLKYEPTSIPNADPTENYNPQDTNINSYLLIYGKQTNPSRFHYSTGAIADREIQDRKKKVYHFTIGQNQGLVKSINFSRVDIPYAKEARLIAAKNENSNILALREVYDVNITLYGNTIWSPGSLIYVDISSQFGNDVILAENMGLQAYYRIINTSSFIENGKYETTIVGKYEFSGNRKIDNREASEGAEECASLNDPKYNTTPAPRAEGPINRGLDGNTTNK